MEVVDKVIKQRRVALLLLTCSALFWSSNFIIGRAVRAEIPPVTLAMGRWFLAALILLPFAGRGVWQQRQLLLTHWPMVLLLSLLSVTGFNTFVYLGLQTTTATNGVLILASMPVFIAFLSRMVLRTPLSGYLISGIALSTAGVVVILVRGSWNLFTAFTIQSGDIWILVAVIDWALYSVLLTFRPQAIKPLNFLLATILIGVAGLIPFWLWEFIGLKTVDLGVTFWSSTLYIALFPSILALLFWNRGVQEVGAATAGQFIHLMPVFGSLMAIQFLGEQMHSYHLYGVVLVAIGLVLASRKVR